MEELTYSQAIEKVMLNNWYYAPLWLIYKEIEKYRSKTWKTPNNTIQERVQRDKKFTKIWLWVYWLTEFLDRLPKEIESKSEKQQIQRMHTHIQWMLIEIWNIEWFETYTPDKNWIFVNRELWKIATLENIPQFTYKNIIDDSVRFVDVIWFNERWFPVKLFEVENSTDFRAGFIKFNELQDFRSEFVFVAPEERKSKFQIEKTKSAFKNISNRTGFLDYDFVKRRYDNKLQSKEFSNSYL